MCHLDLNVQQTLAARAARHEAEIENNKKLYEKRHAANLNNATLIQMWGYIIIMGAADGFCFARMLSLAVVGDDSLIHALVTLACHLVMEDPVLQEMLVTEEEADNGVSNKTAADYTAAIRKGGWVGQVVGDVMCKLLGVSVSLFAAERHALKCDAEGRALWESTAAYQEVRFNEANSATAACVFAELNSQGNHYNLVKLEGGAPLQSSSQVQYRFVSSVFFPESITLNSMLYSRVQSVKANVESVLERYSLLPQCNEFETVERKPQSPRTVSICQPPPLASVWVRNLYSHGMKQCDSKLSDNFCSLCSCIACGLQAVRTAAAESALTVQKRAEVLVSLKQKLKASFFLVIFF